MEGRFGVYEAFRKTFTKIRQAAFMYRVPDVDRPCTDHRPKKGGGEAAAPLPAAGAEALLLRGRVDGAPELEAALLSNEGPRWKDGERPRDHGTVCAEVAPP